MKVNKFTKICSLAVLLLTLSFLFTANVALAQQKPLTIAISDDYKPFTFLGPGGKPRGLLIDLWELWSETTGVPVHFVAVGWTESLEGVKSGTIDIHVGLFKNSEREEWMDFSIPFHETKTAVYSLAEGTKTFQISGIPTGKVGASGGSHQESYLKQQYPGIEVVGLEGYAGMITALMTGKIDYAVAETPPFESFIDELGIRRDVARSADDLLSNMVHAGVRKGNAELLAKIDEGFSSLPFDKLVELDEFWLRNPADRFYRKVSEYVELTREEEDWLATHPFIRLAVTSFIKPVDIVDSAGNYSGMNADLMNLLNKKLGTRIVPEIFHKWSDVSESTLSGAVDGAFSFSRTEEREKHVYYTKPYAYDPVIVIGRQGDKTVQSWDDLSGKRISVAKGFSIVDEVRRQVGEGELIVVESDTKGLQMLSEGGVDAHISFQLPYDNAYKNAKVTGLRIILTRNDEAGAFRIAIHNSRPILFSIIQKGMNALTRLELAALHFKWLAPQQSQEPAQDKLNLTQEERHWLDLNDEIRVGMMSDWPPFSFVDENGIKSGISPSFVEAINKRLGGRLKLNPGPWKGHLEDLKEGKIDALLDLTPSDARRQIYNFTEPYLTIPHVIIGPRDGAYLDDEASLKGKTLALEKGFGNVKYFRDKYPDVIIKEYKDTRTALDAVSRGEADAYAGNRAVAAYFMAKEVMLGLKPHGRLNKPGSVLALGVRKDWPVLASILQKTLDDIDQEESRAILRIWVSSSEDDKAEQTETIVMSNEEKAWLASHQTIKIGVDPAYPPFEFIDERGVYSGMASDYLKLIEKRLGVTFKVAPDLTWPQVIEGTKDGTVDIAPVITPSLEREEFLNFTRSYISFPQVVVTRKDYPTISGLDDLAGKIVASSEGYVEIGKMSQLHPEIKQLIVDSPLAELNAVATGKADAAQGSLAVISYLIEKHNLLNLHIAASSDIPGGEMAMGVRLDWPLLAGLLQKALDNISQDERRAITRKWVGAPDYESDKKVLSFSEDETAWLRDHKTVRVMVGTWPPFHFMDNDNPKGLALDYVKTVLDSVGLDIDYVPISWAEGLKGISNLEKVDLLPTIAHSPERAKLVAFTRPYLSFPRVIFARTDDNTIGTLKDLYGRTVAVEKNFITQKLLKTDHPQIKLLEVPSTKDALEAVSFGRADAFVSNQAVGIYLAEDLGLFNIKVAAQTLYKNDIQSMGVRKDWPELASILNKALDALSETEKHEIRERWISGIAPPTTGKAEIESTDLILQIGGGITVMIVLLLAMVLAMKILEGKDTSRLYQSREVKGLGLLLIGVFLCVVVLSAWYTVKSVEDRARNDIGYSLQTILHSTHEALTLWLDGKKTDLSSISEAFGPRTLIKNLLEVPPNQEALLKSSQLFQIRNMLETEQNRIGKAGFFVITPDGVSIGSMRDANVGSINLIYKQKRELFDRVLQGETVLIPPIVSDVEAHRSGQESTMFLAAPVKDLSLKKVIAVLTMRLDPHGEFSRIIQLGRMGLSGETYAFDDKGKLLSESRFMDDLMQTGLLNPGDESILNIRIADPGGNLLQGYALPENMENLPLTLMARKAIAGENGLNVEGYIDYRGQPVMGAWLWDKQIGIGMTTEVDVDEAMNSYFTIRNTVMIVLAITVVMALILTGLSTWIGRSANRSLSKARDDLERKVEERTRELDERSNLLQTILGSMTQGIVAFDKDLKLISWNDKFREIRAYPDEMLVEGQDFRDFMQYDIDRKEFVFEEPGLGLEEQVERAKKFEIHAFERQRPDGSFIEVSGGPIPGGGFVSTFTDITKRKKADEEIRKLSIAIEQSPVSIVITDLDGTIEYVNPQFTKASGYTFEEAKGQNPRVLNSGENDPKVFKEMWDTLTDGQTWSGELLNKGKTGQLYWEFVNISPITTDEGEVTHFLGVKEDITDRKRAEVELILAMEKAESATRAKSSFLAAMSHEIRTPMNGVVGMIDLLRETKLDPDQNDMMRTVRDSAFSLLQIINDILDFSKIEAGKLDIEMIPVSVRDVVEGVTATLLPNAAPKNLRLMLYIDPEIPSWLLSDQVRLRQILFNLAGNAVKFTESGPDKQGKVIIRADLKGKPDKNKATIDFSIIDNGIGMSKNAVTNLFKPFTQAETSTTRRFGGTGLGLSICKNLTDIMKGKIEVESVEDEGSTFSISIPFEVADKEPDAADSHDLSGLNILVAIHSEEGRTFTDSYLRHYGGETVMTANIANVEGMVEEAIAEGKPFDIVVIGSEWQGEAQQKLIETLRKGGESLRYVTLTSDQKARKGMVLPDSVVVETNPLRRSSFVRGVAMAAGRASPDVEYEEGTRLGTGKKAPSLDEARAAGQLILVAEDNVTNQDVIRRQLGVLGYACEIMNDGVEALDAWQSNKYAVLLTDCHMPNMDGYELTGTIRDAEAQSDDDVRIPIIAITANALQGEVDHCLEVGMDDYLAKPLEMDKLKKTLAKWMPISATALPVPEAEQPVIEDRPEPELEPEKTPAPEVASAEGPAIDERALKDIFGDDDVTFKEILGDFVEPSAAIVKEITDAYAARDATVIGSAGHKLKSSSRSVGAHTLADLCANLEKVGKAADWDAIDEAMPGLEPALREVMDYIDAL